MHLCAEGNKTMGWSPLVHGSHGYPKGRQADDLDSWARQRSAQAREAAKSEPIQRSQPVRDTLELSSRQSQQKLGRVQFAPIPIFTTTGRVDFTT